MAVISGGEKLKARLAEMLKKAESAKEVKVGFLPGATYPDGTSVAMVAALNEYGVPSHNQPPRPFFRNCVAKNHKAWGEGLANLLVLHNYDARKALSYLGYQVSGDLIEEIQEFKNPPNAPSTIAAKKFANGNRPLIDTGHMINSVDFEVIE